MGERERGHTLVTKVCGSFWARGREAIHCPRKYLALGSFALQVIFGRVRSFRKRGGGGLGVWGGEGSCGRDGGWDGRAQERAHRELGHGAGESGEDVPLQPTHHHAGARVRGGRAVLHVPGHHGRIRKCFAFRDAQRGSDGVVGGARFVLVGIGFRVALDVGRGCGEGN